MTIDVQMEDLSIRDEDDCITEEVKISRRAYWLLNLDWGWYIMIVEDLNVAVYRYQWTLLRKFNEYLYLINRVILFPCFDMWTINTS